MLSARRFEQSVGGRERARAVVLLAAVLAFESADLGTVGATARQLERALHIDHERLRAELDVPVAHVVVELAARR